MKVLAFAVLLFGGNPTLPPELASLISKLFGGILILVLLHQLGTRGGTPAEVKLYFTFLLWAVVSSVVVAEDVDRSLRTAWTVFQAGLLLWAMAVAHQRHPDLRIVMSFVWGFGVYYILLALFDPASIAVLKGSGERLFVMGMNPNAGGQTLVFAIFAALYLGKRVISWRTKMLLLGSIPVFAVFLLNTGSRKMLVAAIIGAAGWVLTSTRVGAARGKRRLSLFIVALAVTAVAVVAVSSWEGSIMARRWDSLLDPKTRLASLGGRDDFYKEGWQLFLENPVAGVGLLNQEAIMGTLAHSDFIDVLASTGIVGAALYFSIYLVAFRRAQRASRGSKGVLRLDWRAFRVYAIMMAWLMVGFSRYTDMLHILVFGSFVGLFLRTEIKARDLRDEHTA